MCQLFHISPLPLYSFEALFWVDCPKMVTQHVLEDLCGSTCLRSGWVLISHEVSQWKLPTPCLFPSRFYRTLHLKEQVKISTVPFKPVSALKSQQENEQLTKPLHGFEELLISLIGTSYAFISSSEPCQTPARLNHFSWKMRNCKSSRLPQQQSGFSSGNAIDKEAKNLPVSRHCTFNSIFQSWAQETPWRWGWDLWELRRGPIPKRHRSPWAGRTHQAPKGNSFAAKMPFR